MKLFPDIVQVNIYGQTLSELLQKGINIPLLLNKLGIEECVVFDVPRFAKSKKINDTSLQNSIVLSEANQPAKNDKQLAQEFYLYGKKWPRCSTPLHSIDGLLDCSYSTIDNDETTVNVNIEMLRLDSITEKDEEDSTIVPTVEKDDNTIIYNNTKEIISDLLSQLLNEIEEEFISYHVENENYFEEEVFDVKSNNTTNLQSYKSAIDENATLNILNRESSMEIISELLNDLLNKIEEKGVEDNNEHINIPSVFEEYNTILEEFNLDKNLQFQSFEILDTDFGSDDFFDNLVGTCESFYEENPPVLSPKVSEELPLNNKRQIAKNNGNDSTSAKIPRIEESDKSSITAASYATIDLDVNTSFSLTGIRHKLGKKTKSPAISKPRPSKTATIIACSHEIRDHHKLKHAGMEWNGPKRVETQEDLEELVKLFRKCFPGWEAKFRIDGNIPDVVAQNKYLGVEAFIKFSKKSMDSHKSMSNFTHIPKWGPQNHRHGPQQGQWPEPKYKFGKRQSGFAGIKEGAVKTVYRNYNHRGRGAKMHSPGRVTKERVTHKAGLFRNGKESFHVNSLSTMDRFQAISRITRPEDSVEYLRPPIDDYLESRRQHEQYNRDQYTNNTSGPPPPKRGHFAVERNFTQRNHYPKNSETNLIYQGPAGYQCQMREYGKERRFNNQYHQREKTMHRNFDGVQSNSNWSHRNANDQYRYQRREPETRHREQRRECFRVPFKSQSSLAECDERDSSFNRSHDSPQIFSQGYTSPSRSSQTNIQNWRTDVTPFAGELAIPVHQEINYPVKMLATRMLGAIPGIPLRDDANDRYGATARNLLMSSIAARNERTVQETRSSNGVTMQDLLNQTTILNFDITARRNEHNTVQNENIFQHEHNRPFLGRSNSTPEREREFNRTLVEPNNDDNYQIIGVEDFNFIVQSPKIGENENMVLPNSPSEDDFMREINELIKPRVEDMPFSGSLF